MNKMTREIGIKLLKLGIVFTAVYLGMKYIFPIILPFFIGLILAKLLYPLARKIEEKTKLNRSLARSVAYFVFLGGIGLLLAGLLYLCYRMGSSCLDNLSGFLEQADGILGQCCRKIEVVTGFSTDSIQRKMNESVSGLTDGAMDFSKEAGGSIIAFLAKVLVTCVATLLILNEYEEIVSGIKSNPVGKRTVEVLKNIRNAAGEYIKAQIRIIAIITSLCILGLWILRTENFFIIGILIGLCDALPFLGTGTVFIPWALITLLLGNYGSAAGYLIVYLVCTFTRQMLEPKLVGNGLGVPPLAVLMSIYIGLQLYGAIGVILGPVSALIIAEIWKSLDKSKEQSLQ